MARVVACLALIAPAAGLVAPAAPAASTALKAEAAASLKGMSGGVQAGDPMPGEGPWDPIGFSKLHENIQGSEHAGVVPSQQWMREAEIKHGRVRYGVRLPSHLDGATPHAIDAKNTTRNTAPTHRRRSIFQELAKKFSECGSAKKGGDLGMFRRGKMSAAFELAAFNLDVHELSKTVASSSGVHLIYRVA